MRVHGLVLIPKVVDLWQFTGLCRSELTVIGRFHYLANGRETPSGLDVEVRIRHLKNTLYKQ